jgi:hypothetical protein
LKTNIAITRKKMCAARKLEAEWRRVLRGSVSTGVKEAKSSTGQVWTTGFHRPFSLGVRFETYEPFLYLTLSLLMSYIYGVPCKARNFYRHIYICMDLCLAMLKAVYFYLLYNVPTLNQ